MRDIKSLPTGPPSSWKLFRSTVIAAAIASALLITVVFPAEYGVDLTGAGAVLGLTRMGRIKETLSGRARASAVALATYADPGAKTHLTEIKLLPSEGRELRLVMTKGARMNYAWSAEGGSVDYDMRGEPPNPAPGLYHEYGKGSALSDEGVLVAAFDGTHGWFWQNRTEKTVIVTLRTNGNYDGLHEVK